jgi:GT2 family glycosyltransferase
MINQLKFKINENKIDYESIKSNAMINLLNDEEFDVNIIIGCRGRKNFTMPLIESFENAIKNTPDKKITITFVDHNTFPEHMKLVKGRASYMWTEGNVSDQYSRSFAYNFGVKYGNKAKFYLLHDLDILVKENFFNELFENLGEQKCIQPYGGRRVLYMSESLTKRVIEKEIDYNNFNQDSPDVSLPMFNGQPALGSKGGSIFIERELFEEVGGFDPELFWGYAAEDQFFWEKVNAVSKVGFADSPLIDMFHMWHPPSYVTNPLLHIMENDWIMFKNLNTEEKMEIINLKKKLYAE